MIKPIYKGVSLMMALALTVTMSYGCNNKTDNSEKSAKKENAQNDNNAAALSKLIESKIGDAKNTDKDESVFVEMDSQGEVLKTTVSDTLKTEGNDNIKDESELEDIINLTGDEKFARDSKGELIWENKGKDIKYQGKTNKKTPIEINIKYYLNNKLIDAKDIAGKSGHVDIEYNYKNNTVDNEYVPFIVLTGMALDRNKFKNVEIDHGKVVTYNESHLVLGFAVPGIKEEIQSKVESKTGLLEKIDIPNSITVSADVEDFETSMAMTYATSNLIDKDLTDKLDLSNITEKMDELQKGADTLVDGADKLADGAHQLNDGTAQLKDGSSKLLKGDQTLFDGTDKLLVNYKVFNKGLLDALKKSAKGTNQLYNGVKPLKKGTKDLDNGAKNLDEGAKKIKDGSKDLDDAAGQIKDGAGTLKNGTASVKDGTSQLASGLKDVKKGFDGSEKNPGLKDGAKQVSDGAQSAKEGVGELVTVLKQTPESIKKNISDIIAKVKNVSGGAISSEAQLNATVEGINHAVAGGTELSTVLAANGLNTQTYYGLLEAYYSIKTLNSVNEAMTQQIGSKQKEIEALLEGMNELSKGSKSVSDGINQAGAGVDELYKGAKALDKGASNLDNGAKDLSEGTGKLKNGTESLSKGSKDLSDGTKKLSDGTKSLSDSSKTLVLGIKKLRDGSVLMKDKLSVASPKIKNGVQQLRDGAKTLKDGQGELDNGINKLKDGASQLDDGSAQLKDGTVKINEDGISRITEVLGENAPILSDEIEKIIESGKQYNNFSGIHSPMSGEVKFIFKTQEIKK